MRAIRHRRRSIPALAALAATAVAAPVLLAAAPAAAHPREGRLARELVTEVTARGAEPHQAKLQRIAEAHGGHPAPRPPGPPPTAPKLHH
ncbi:amidohydrolase, partial [Streptomyces sp. NPDC059456]